MEEEAEEMEEHVMPLHDIGYRYIALHDYDGQVAVIRGRAHV